MGFGVYYRVGTGYWQIIYADIEGTEGWESRTIELPADALTDHVQIGFQLGSGISLSGVEVFKRSLIYTSLDDGFENGISPDWTRINGENGLEWLTSSGPTTYGSAHGGRLDAQVSLKGSASEAWLITPKLQLDMLNYAVFSFWYYSQSNSFSVYYRHGSGEWVQLFTPSIGSDQWRKKTFIFSGDMLQADTEIGFKVTDRNYGSGTFAIDDVKLESGNPPMPHLVQLENQTMYGASVVIDHEIAIPGEKVTIDVTPNSTFSEMLPFEVYGVFVTCDGQAIEVTEENAHRYSFNMPNGDVSVMVSIDQLNGTYFQDFSDPTTVNADWTFTDGSTLGYQGVAVIPSGEYAIMPAQIITNNHGLRFWIRETDSYHCTGSMAVYVGTTRDVRKMTKISPDYVATSTQTCYKLDLSAYSGQKVYIAFGHKNCNYGSLELDRVLLYHPTLGQSEPYVNDLGFEGGYPALTYRDSANGYGWFIGTGDNDASTGSPQGTHNLVAKSVHVGDEAYMSGSFSVSNFTNVPKLSFWLIDRAKGTAFDKLQVYYRVDSGAWQLAYETTEAVNDWTLQDVYFPKEAISWGFDLKFVATDCGGNGIGIDNIAVTDADPFLIVVDRSIEHGTVIANPSSSVAGEYVTLYVNAETGYRLESITATCGDQNIYLQKSPNGTEYYFQMPAGKVNVTATFVEKVVCTELHEDFENGMPEGWHNETAGGYDWVIGTGDDLEQIGSHSGRSNAVIKSSGKMSGEYFITPYLDLSGSEKALLHFWYLNRTNNGNTNMFYVCYRINNGTWNWYYCVNSSAEVWTDQYVLLPDSILQENVEIGFFVMDNAGHGVAIDDVSLIRSDKLYYQVGSIEIDGQGSVKPAQNYYQQGSTVDLYVTPFDVDLEIDTISATSSNQDISLTKVDDCHYTFTMPADGVTVNATFKTKTSVRKVFVEDFESADSFAWTFAEPTAQIACWYLTGANDGMGHSQTTALYSCAPADANNVPYDHWAFTPAISVPESARLSFWLREADYTNELVDIYVGETGNMYDMTYLMTIEPMAYYQRYEIELDEYEGQNVVVAFRHHSEGNTLSALKEVYLDDVCVYTEAPLPKAPAKMRYAKAAFEGKLGVVYHMELPDWLVEDTGAYVRFYVAGKSYKKKLTNFTKNGAADDGTYRLAYYVPAAYYRETVTLRLYDGTGKLVQIIGNTGHDYTDEGVGYSLERYANTLMADSNPAVVELAVALENYCTATQIAFGYNSENLTLSSEVTDAVIENLDQYQSYGSTQLITGLAKKTLKASFDSDNSLKFGVVFAQGYGPEDFEYFIDGESAVLQGSQEDGYYLVVKNVAAAQLHVVHEFKIVRGNDVFVSNCSVLTYARAIIKTGTTEFQNLGKALILYNAAARNYFGVE
ncbi:MAG: choice-of-anchor J domain-containing protein [Lachnospiraceae bacterium]|nr:choice-of-anchor J domain-containing protein [Lachnospiraceae bacterium]